MSQSEPSTSNGHRRGGASRPRRCILHVGSPKTASSSIQFVLKENRKQFLKDGFLVPESGQTAMGAHRPLAFSLSGMQAPPEAASAEQDLVREVSDSDAHSVLISSEFLWTILTHEDRAKRLIGQLRSLGLDITIVMYVRNQPQYINSFYQHNANFRGNCDFSSFASRAQRNKRMYTYSRWIAFAETHDVPLLARPFSEEVRKRGVIEDFLTTAGLASASHYNTAVELRRSVGPFRVAVAQSLMQRVGDPKRLTEQQASECRRVVSGELKRRKIDDRGYCGLTTELAEEIEQKFSDDNARFSQFAWGKPWNEVFASDVGQIFKPNDYSMTGIPADRRQLLSEVLASLEPKIDAILAH